MKKIKLLFMFLIIIFSSFLVGCSWYNELCVNNILKADEGVLYTLQEAYDLGLLGVEEIKSIAHYQSAGRDEPDIDPIPINPEKLSPEVEKKIKISYARIIYMNDKSSGDGKVKRKINLDEIRLLAYYGTYNDCIAFKITWDYYGYPGVIITEKIAGVKISYSGPKVMIWKPNK